MRLRTKGIFLMLFLCLTMVPRVQAGLIDSLFACGNRFYEAEKYTEAVQTYQEVVRRNVHHAALYYNLGNCYYKMNQIGLAILNYEKARKLAPMDEDINMNLRFAVMQTIDKQGGGDSGTVWRLIARMNNLFTVRQTIIFLSVLYFLIFGLLSWRFFAWIRLKPVLLALPVMMAVVAVILGASLFFRIYQSETRREAIVLCPSTAVRNAPDGDQVLFNVHEGLKFRVVRKLQGWSFVSLPNGNSGWVPEKNLGEIF